MANRRLDAILAEVSRGGPVENPHVLLVFRTTSPRAPADQIEDFADLGPELTLESALGIGKVLRLLRAARIAAPRDASVLLGDPEHTASLLERAIGTAVVVEVRARSSLRFTVWTDEGVEDVHHVTEVLESPDAFTVRRMMGKLPVRVPRERVVRQQTTRDRWLEVISIERPEP